MKYLQTMKHCRNKKIQFGVSRFKGEIDCISLDYFSLGVLTL